MFWLSEGTAAKGLPDAYTLTDYRHETHAAKFAASSGPDPTRPCVLPAVELFGADRCMLGSDLPIERLRPGFRPLFAAYDEIFAQHSDAERRMPAHGTAQNWYGRERPGG